MDTVYIELINMYFNIILFNGITYCYCYPDYDPSLAMTKASPKLILV